MWLDVLREMRRIIHTITILAVLPVLGSSVATATARITELREHHVAGIDCWKKIAILQMNGFACVKADKKRMD